MPDKGMNCTPWRTLLPSVPVLSQSQGWRGLLREGWDPHPVLPPGGGRGIESGDKSHLPVISAAGRNLALPCHEISPRGVYPAVSHRRARGTNGEHARPGSAGRAGVEGLVEMTKKGGAFVQMTKREWCSSNWSTCVFTGIGSGPKQKTPSSRWRLLLWFGLR
jgi:hypothetical protein